MSGWLSVSYIKRKLSVTDPNGVHRSDDLLEICAAEACRWVETETGRTFLSATYRRVFDGANMGRLYLPAVPVTALLDLKINRQSIAFGTAEEFADGTVEAYFDEIGILFPRRRPCGPAAIVVEWTAGYTEAAIPAEVLSIAASVAILKFRERDRTGAATTSIGGQSIVYDRELPALERSALESMRDWSRLYRQAGYPA